MNMHVDFASMQVPGVFIQEYGEKLRPLIEILKSLPGYDTVYASCSLPFDTNLLQSIEKAIYIQKQRNPQAIVIIGIGGSNLGTMAIQQALYGLMHNEWPEHMKIYYADTVDTDALYDVLLRVEQLLLEEQTILLNIISKSGSTTETIANAELFIALLKKYLGDEYREYVVVTTDKESSLWHQALQENYMVLEIPKNVGGRYSVFSAVGLFPLGMLGVNLNELQQGARTMFLACTAYDNNPAALSALVQYYWYLKGWRIHDTFIFAKELAAVGAWYRQLVGESLGKEYDVQRKQVHAGIIPLVSVGTTDLHSMGQLYLSGDYGMYTTFVSVKKMQSVCQIPHDPLFNRLAPHLNNKTVPDIMQAILQGVQQAYQIRKKPFGTLALTHISAASIAALLQFKMCEVIYLGCLLDVSPFDQPNVELYKKETQRILANE